MTQCGSAVELWQYVKHRLASKSAYKNVPPTWTVKDLCVCTILGRIKGFHLFLYYPKQITSQVQHTVLSKMTMDECETRLYTCASDGCLWQQPGLESEDRGGNDSYFLLTQACVCLIALLHTQAAGPPHNTAPVSLRADCLSTRAASDW